MSLADLKKKRGSKIDQLRQKTDQEEKGGKSFQDDRFWYPQRDDNGNAATIIRFLPEPQGEEMPYVYYWHHGFKGPGGWYIENSRTTLGDDDPVTYYNSILWDSGVDEYKELARSRKRRLTYVSNILVIKDPKNPENEGKVFLFKYGKKIHDMVKSCLRPEFDDEEPFNPFDFWDGANFKFKIRRVDGQTNYDKSEFESPSALFDGDENKLEEVYENLHSLQEFVKPDAFKDYETLRNRFVKAVGPHDPVWKLAGETPENATDNQRREQMTTHEATQTETGSKPEPGESQIDVSDSGDDDLDQYKKLAEDDDDDLPFKDL